MRVDGEELLFRCKTCEGLWRWVASSDAAGTVITWTLDRFPRNCESCRRHADDLDVRLKARHDF